MSYLRDNHQVSKSDQRGLTRYLTSIYPNRFRNPADVPLCNKGSDAHLYLRVYDGYSCQECRYYAINYLELSKYILKNHLNGQQVLRGRIQDLYDDVYLQTWTYGSSWCYWKVKKDRNIIRPVAGRDVTEHL